MILASVVFPEPGGPQKMQDPISPRRISSPRGFPGPSRCSWPRNSSRVVGRMRAARGSAERANRVGSDTGRSEEHTSELQSPCNLVCRLLLEKKKKKKYSNHV